MQRLDPSQNKRKQQQNTRWVWIAGSVIFTVLILVMLLVVVLKHHHKKTAHHLRPTPHWIPVTQMDNLTEHATDSAISVLHDNAVQTEKSVQAKFVRLNEKIDKLTALLTTLKNAKKTAPSASSKATPSTTPPPVPHPEPLPTGGPSGNPGENNQAFGQNRYTPTPMNGEMGTGVADFTFVEAKSPDAPSPDACDSRHCLLPGSFAKAVLLGGADANASVNGQSNTTPLLFRVLGRAHLPNGHTINIKGCFVVATVYGDISSERGEVKLTHLSCILHGKVISRPIALGTAYDIGGKEGIRGLPVMRNGKLLLYSGLSGFASGIGSALQQSYTTQSISPLGATSTVSNDKIAQYGAATGASTALGKLASYYIKRADQYHPVIELNPGAKVDLVFLSQINLHPDAKAHTNDGQGVASTHPALTGLRFGQTVSSQQALALQKKLIQQYGGHQ